MERVRAHSHVADATDDGNAIDNSKDNSKDKNKVNGQFLPGNSIARRGGRPKGARNKLGEAFLLALKEDFEKYGKRSIERCRLNDPVQYCRMISNLLPKQLEIDDKTPLKDMSIDQLKQSILDLRKKLDPVLNTPAKEEPNIPPAHLMN